MTNKRNRNKVQKLHRTGCTDPRLKHGYMDLTDFLYELGEAAGGNRVFASVNDLIENQPCADECGIVKVAFVDEEIVQHDNFHQLKEEKVDTRIKHVENMLVKAKRNVVWYENRLTDLKAGKDV